MLEQEQAAQKLQQQRHVLRFIGLILLIVAITAVFIYRNYLKSRAISLELANKSEQLQATNRKLQRFAGSVSHDILSNLNMILSIGEVLVRHRTEQLEPLQTFYSQAMLLTRQTKDYCIGLLQSAKADRTGARALAATETQQVVQDVAAGIQRIYPDVHIDLPLLPTSLSLSLSLPLTAPDLTQILHNLLDNAARHAAMGEQAVLEVTVSVNEDQVSIGVLDNGPGFASDLLISDLFQAGVSGRPGGHGMGLHIVKTIIEEAGGRIWAENRPTGGAAVWFSFRE